MAALALSPASAETGGTPPAAAAAEDARPATTADADRVLTWIAESNDNGSLPYMVIDKNAATLHVFAADGKPVGHAPILIGVGKGDDATPGVGDKELSKIGPAERTTPAGRYLAKYGRAIGSQRVLWVDWSTSVALHPVITSNSKERRLERLKSADPEDNRITFGCINVPTEFYRKQVRPLFQKAGGVVYVLPDTKALEDVFPLLRVHGLTQPEPAIQS